MNRIFTSFFVFFLTTASLPAQSPLKFDDYFVDRTMRIDYFHIGDSKEEWITIDQIYEQGIWAGSLRNLLDKFDNGRYYAKVYDVPSGRLIFSKGWDSYFGEYKTTGQALRGLKKTYHETVLIPYPKKKIKFTLEVRNRENILQLLFSQEVDPSSISIIKERSDKGVKVFEILKSGDPHERVDVAFIAEGYTRKEEGKLKADLELFTKVFFNHEPYKTYKAEFNIYGVFKPSDESGCDEPRHGVYKNTAVSASFNALGSERYLLTEDNKSLRDIAAHVP
jgi:hypothetical protein